MTLKRHLFVPRSAAPIKLQQRNEGELPKIGGYGAVYYKEGDPSTEYRLWDDYVERIMPGAFDEAIRSDSDVRSFFNHDTNLVLGRSTSGTLALSVDAVGLAYEVTPPDTQAARDLIKSLEREDVTGSSFMFDMEGGETVWREQDDLFIREIHKIGRLYEVGPVTFPAYEGTSSGTRFADELAEVRQLIESRKADIARQQDGVRGGNPKEPSDCPGCQQLQRQFRAIETRVKLLETR